MTQSRPKAFVGLMAITLVGQMTVLAYDVAVTRQFGTTVHADALALAFMVAFALGNEVAGWVGAVVVPKYLETEQAGVDTAGGFLSAILIAVSVMTAIIAAMLMSLAPVVSAMLGESRAAHDALVRLFAPLVVLLPVAAILASALHAKERFSLAAMRPVLGYGAAFIGVVVWGGAGTAVVPIAMTAGLAGYSTILAFAARPAMRQPRAGAWHQLRRVACSVAPLAVMSVINYSQILVERGLAAQLGEGALSAMTYAFRLVNAPITLLVVTAATMLFPLMSTRRMREGEAAATSVVLRAVGLSMMVATPLAGLLMSCSDLIVTLLFQRGAFNPDSSRMTALAVFYYAPALVGLTAVQLLVRAYWALGRIRRLAAIHLGAGVFGILVMAGLAVAMGFRGLAIAVSITALVHAAGLLAGLPRQSSGSALRSLGSLAVRVCATTSLAVAAAFLARRAPGNMVCQLGFGLGTGMIVYAFLIKRVAPLEWASTIGALSIWRHRPERHVPRI